MTGPRILLWDTETSPNLGWTWAKYEQTVISFEDHWHFLAVGWTWLGDRTVNVRGLDDFPKYSKDPDNDIELVKLAWSLFDEADIVVAHNGVAYDTRKAQARMLYHGMDPPSSFKEVDTLRLARKHFSFTSNRLGDVCEFLGIGSKLETGGFETWLGCIQGDAKAWARMKRYCRQDVLLLRDLYLKLRPWAPSHPNLATISGRPDACPRCGGNAGMMARGYTYTAVSRRARFCCKNCGAFVSGRTVQRTETGYVS